MSLLSTVAGSDACYERCMRYPNRIREHREAKGWTQQRLSEEAGVSRSYLSEIETGEKRVNNQRLALIARALGKTQADLVPGDPHAMRGDEIMAALDGLPDEDWSAVKEYAMLRRRARLTPAEGE